MLNFAAGVTRFQRDVFPTKQELFKKLSKGQTPEALFITCSGLRIETAMITQTNPGGLFICRNAGNIVPPHTTATGAMTASIEFAAASLKVPHIVVCGHTECVAMKGAMESDALDELLNIKEWLSFSKAGVDLGTDLDEWGRVNTLLEQNVILQLQHLKTHPTVALRLAKHEVQLHGWVYDIASGKVRAYDELTKKFLPVAERYADAVELSESA